MRRGQLPLTRGCIGTRCAREGFPQPSSGATHASQGDVKDAAWCNDAVKKTVKTFGIWTCWSTTRRSRNTKRPSKPEELSSAYVFLAAPSCSSYITGVVLPVTGSVGAI